MHAIFKAENDKLEKRATIKTWSWIDKEWWIVHDSGDKGGWRYSDNTWKHFMRVPSPNTFTRTRKWCRRAKLVEKQIAFHESE